MEGLNCLISAAEREGLLQNLGQHGIKERAFFYADDVILFLVPRELDLVLTKTILDIFGCASGLQINPSKCMINPIQCGLDDSVRLLQFSQVVYRASHANIWGSHFRSEN
jgi:hypothetical protein